MEELLANQPMEYEEVVLKRSKSNRRLGLTLCYGGTDDSETDIFVSEVRTHLTLHTYPIRRVKQWHIMISEPTGGCFGCEISTRIS